MIVVLMLLQKSDEMTIGKTQPTLIIFEPVGNRQFEPDVLSVQF